MEFQKFVPKGKIEMASKKSNKSYKKQSAKKKKCERNMKLRVPKRGILWREVRNWFKTRTGHSQKNAKNVFSSHPRVQK